jgi:hypothetical protein
LPARKSILAVAIGVLAIAAPSNDALAQGLSLIENCPVDITPLERVLPAQGKHTYTVTARFIIDVNGAVIAPSVRQSKLVMSGNAVPVPPTVDRTFLDALKKWRYARRAKPCLGSVDLEMLLSV